MWASSHEQNPELHDTERHHRRRRSHYKRRGAQRSGSLPRRTEPVELQQLWFTISITVTDNDFYQIKRALSIKNYLFSKKKFKFIKIYSLCYTTREINDVKSIENFVYCNDENSFIVFCSFVCCADEFFFIY